MYTSHNNGKLFNSLFIEWDTFPQWEGMSYNPAPPYGRLSDACWWGREARHKITDLMSWIQRNEAQKCARSRHLSGRESPEVCTLTPFIRKGKPRSVHAHAIRQEGEAQKCARSHYWSGRGSPEEYTLTLLVRKDSLGLRWRVEHLGAGSILSVLVIVVSMRSLCAAHFFSTFIVTGCLTYGA